MGKVTPRGTHFDLRLRYKQQEKTGKNRKFDGNDTGITFWQLIFPNTSDTDETVVTTRSNSSGFECKSLITKGLEVRGFEPLAFSLRTRRSTN